MAFFDHVVACNTYDLSKFRPFLADGRQVGWVREDTVRLLRDYDDVFRLGKEGLSLAPGLRSPGERSEAVADVLERLAERELGPSLRGEDYAVVTRWGEAPLFTIDRGAVTLFGLRAFGVHVNGFVRDAAGPSLWIGRRAMNKSIAPGKLDNLVGGGQPAGLSLTDNLIKEAAEEADIPPEVARRSSPVGAISYCLEDEWGLKPDTMFCFDLELPADFTPRNVDGEVAEFILMPVTEVARRIRDGQEFKYNVNLVIMDFLIRHGVLTADSEPGYLELIRGLHQGEPQRG